MGERCVKRVVEAVGVSMGVTVKIDYGAMPDDHVLQVLGQLVEVDSDFDFGSLRSQWFRRGYITPRQMVLLAWRLKVHGIRHNPVEFRVSTQLPEHREAVLNMEGWKRERLLPYLSVQQKNDFNFK
jgi:hypothetical protein